MSERVTAVLADSEPAGELPDVLAGRLPARYAQPLQTPFLAAVLPALAPGATVLDVGSGRRPAVDPGLRPPRLRYIGLDISHDELAAAPAGAYDEICVADIAAGAKTLDSDTVDVVVSWQMLEHVDDTRRALEEMRRILRPGGRMVTQLSGTFAVFSLLARIAPHRWRAVAMSKLLGDQPETKFPTRYDRCWEAKLAQILAAWESAWITPYWRGAAYFGFSPTLQRGYLRYEDWIERRDMRNLATHYLVVACK